MQETLNVAVGEPPFLQRKKDVLRDERILLESSLYMGKVLRSQHSCLGPEAISSLLKSSISQTHAEAPTLCQTLLCGLEKLSTRAVVC